MKTLKLTRKDFKGTDSYWKEYVGKEDVSVYEGNIEIEGGLGYVRFASLKATGFVLSGAGTGIEAGEGIKSGWGIEAGMGIKAGTGIKAGMSIEAGDGIEAGWGIKAGDGIEAGDGIKAGEGIKAGWGIEAGDGIEAGAGIVSGLEITCKLALSSSLRIFAGVCWWRKIDEEEKTITCGKLESGVVAYGILKEIGMPVVAIDKETGIATD